MTCTHPHLTVHHSFEKRSSTAECGVCGRKSLPYIWHEDDNLRSEDFLGHAFQKAIDIFRCTDIFGPDMMPVDGDK